MNDAFDAATPDAAAPIRPERTPTALTADDLRRNLAAVHARIAAACRRAGRDPASVRLLPVSKTVDEARVRLAHTPQVFCFPVKKIVDIIIAVCYTYFTGRKCLPAGH